MDTTGKYLLLIHLAADARQEWDAMTPAEQAVGLDAHARLREDLAASGELVVAEALADGSAARQVRVVDGRMQTTDGPFGESKEFLAGFYLIECESLDRAAEHAARLPEATVGRVEVRPVLQLGGGEM
ncbi:YciI family protein [Georgenia daeguensis]|uniref:YciI family protein n=1 Tax=Georgenia daeguensis TaxID=908355 RepID=A0ABP8EW76_9MICO